MNEPPHTSAVPSRGRHRRLVLAVLVVAIVVAVAGVMTYIVTRPPALINLEVTDGSTVGLVEGHFTNLTSTNPLLLNFTAATFANQTGRNGSLLRMDLVTWTYYDPLAGAVYLFADLTVAGAFAPNLGPRALEFSANATGQAIELNTHYVPPTTNLSFDSQPIIDIVGNTTGSVSATLTNQSRSAPVYNFGFYPLPYGDMFWILWRPWYSPHLVGFRATVTGPFVPAVSVGILLEVINTSGGTWT